MEIHCFGRWFGKVSIDYPEIVGTIKTFEAVSRVCTFAQVWRPLTSTDYRHVDFGAVIIVRFVCTWGCECSSRSVLCKSIFHKVRSVRTLQRAEYTNSRRGSNYLKYVNLRLVMIQIYAVTGPSGDVPIFDWDQLRAIPSKSDNGGLSGRNSIAQQYGGNLKGSWMLRSSSSGTLSIIRGTPDHQHKWVLDKAVLAGRVLVCCMSSSVSRSSLVTRKAYGQQK